MNGERATGAMAGGLIAGLTLSAVMILGEKLSGRPSELIELERATADKLDIDTRQGNAPATTTEQIVTHSGHLALSALAGLAYAVTVEEGEDNVISGTMFGLAFFVAAYGITGPLLGVTPLPWRQPPLRAVQHPVVHALFGIAAALLAGKRATSARLLTSAA